MLDLKLYEVFFIVFMASAPFLFVFMVLWAYNNHPSTWKYNPFANMPGYKFRQKLWELEHENQA